MCFEMISTVDHVENPDEVFTFNVFKSAQQADVKSARDIIETAAGLYLQQKIVEAVLIEGAKYPSESLEALTSLSELCDRAVLVCAWDRSFSHFGVDANSLIGRKIVHPEQMLISLHQALAGNVVILQLKDFCYIAQYSLTYIEEELLPERVFQSAELRIKLNVDSEVGVIYQ